MAMMDLAALGPDYVPVLFALERTEKELILAEASRALLAGRSPAEILAGYARENSSDDLVIDPDFVCPIGQGPAQTDVAPRLLEPEQSQYFALRGFVRRDARDRLTELKGRKIELQSDPAIGPALTRDTSHAVGKTADVAGKLDVATLRANGLDGANVAIAIVDSGIYLPHLTRLLGAAPKLDAALSWAPANLTPKPGMHRIGHGTMCAYDALIAAPQATLLDIPMLKARAVGEHRAPASVSTAMLAYWPLLYHWVIGPLLGNKPKYDALVISNSWGIFHPSLDDFPVGHPGRFIDNPNHIFRLLIRVLAQAGVDIVFAASNCGPECTSAVCLSRSSGMIMGANAYDEVLTMAGCDVHDERVGYSSRGPSIANMPQQKPDLTAYTHFLGSRTVTLPAWLLARVPGARNDNGYQPDSGTSAACPVAAGCIAALRTKRPGPPTPPISSAAMFQALKNTAHNPPGPGWNPDYGHGIIRPVAAAQSLGLIP
jgi:hypothetical protein